MAKPTCPICKAKLPESPRPPTHPFCSPRCKLVDLGNWLGDGYVIAGEAGENLEDLDMETLAALLREPS
jgi:endogenous inhibitor of DNA gyrase (YacG/DUF329 family)